MEKIPKEFKLYGFEWEVVICDNLREDSNLLGQCQCENLIIKLAKNQTYEDMISSFWHEALHAIRWYSKLNTIKTEDEEIIVDLQANGIMQILTTAKY